MQLLNQENFKTSSTIFKILIKTLQPYGTQPAILGMLSLTLNNLSCCYKRLGKIKQAQQCLEKALMVQQNQDLISLNQLSDGASSISKTHIGDGSTLTELNLCAIYSQQNDHIKAKKYAEIAISKIRTDMESFKEYYRTLPFDQKLKQKQVLNEKVSLLAIANYNLGSQHEFLKEFPDCILRYEEALKLVEDNLEKNCQLAQEFRQSLKQARSRQVAFSMKGENRTFTNLNKQKIQVQGAVAGVGERFSGQEMSFGSTQDNLSQYQLKNLKETESVKVNNRPLSAQVPRNKRINEQQISAQASIPNQYNPLEEISEINHPKKSKEKKIRPTSSYVRTSQNAPQFLHAQPKTQSKRTINESYEAHGIYNDTSIERPKGPNDKRYLNKGGSSSQFSPSIESRLFFPPQNIDVGSEGEEDRSASRMKAHPMLQERVSQRRGLTRPESAKTQFTSHSQNTRKSKGQTQNYFSIRGSKAGLDSSLEKIYCSNSSQLKDLKYQNNLQYNKRDSSSGPSGKPPTVIKKGSSQMRGAKQGSQQRLQQAQTFNQTVLQRTQNNVQSTAFLNESGFNGGRELFSEIDKNFNELRGSTIILKKGEEGSADLNQIYEKEQSKQQRIFYHNNEVLPTYAQKNRLPKFPSHLNESGLSSTKAKDSEIINIKIENSSGSQTIVPRRQNKRTSQRRVFSNKKGKNSKSPNQKPPTSAQTSNQFVSFAANELQPVVDEKRRQSKEKKKGVQNRFTEIIQNEEMKSRDKQKAGVSKTTSLREQLDQVSKKELESIYFNMPSNKEKRLFQYV